MAQPIRTLLSAPTQETINAMFPHFLGDQARVTLNALATTADALAEQLTNVPVEVAVIDAELFYDAGETQLLQFLASRPGQAVLVVLIPPSLQTLAGKINSIATVREVMVKPVNPAPLIDRIFAIGTSERVQRTHLEPAAMPLEGAFSARPGRTSATGVAGFRSYVFMSAKGGVGKTTLSVNFAYALALNGIRTCLIGVDTPDDIHTVLNLPESPNTAHFFHRPGREGFAASIQNLAGLGDLDVVIAPHEESFCLEVASRPPEQPGSIASLIAQARMYSPPYAAVVIDLPPSITDEWAIQPLLQANTFITVVEPSVSAQYKLLHLLRTITGKFDPRFQIPQQSVMAVLNGVTNKDNMRATDIQEALRHFLGWAPPFLAAIAQDPAVRVMANNGTPAYRRVEGVTDGIDNMVDFFYADMLGTRSDRARRQKRQGSDRGLLGGRSFLGVRVRVTE